MPSILDLPLRKDGSTKDWTFYFETEDVAAIRERVKAKEEGAGLLLQPALDACKKIPLVLRKTSTMRVTKCNEEAERDLAGLTAANPTVHLDVQADAELFADIVPSFGTLQLCHTLEGCQVQSDKYTWKQFLVLLVDPDVSEHLQEAYYWCVTKPEREQNPLGTPA